MYTYIGIFHRPGARCRRALGREGAWNKRPSPFSGSVAQPPLLCLSLCVSLSPRHPPTQFFRLAFWASPIHVIYMTILTNILFILIQDSRERESDGCNLGTVSYDWYKQGHGGPSLILPQLDELTLPRVS